MASKVFFSDGRSDSARNGLVPKMLTLFDEAGFCDIASRTYTIERKQPLSDADRAYFQHAVFEGLWGERLEPFLDVENFRKLEANCRPDSSEYCLLRSDFHHIQTLTVCTGKVPVAT